MKIIIALLLSILATTSFARGKNKNCGLIPPGAKFGANCELIPVPPPNFKKVQAPRLNYTDSKSYYLEIHPGEPKVLKFKTDEAKFKCNDKLDLKSFET